MNTEAKMKKSLLGISLLLAGALCSSQAMAWASANRFGGSTEHVPGATEHTNRWGGSSAHAYGEGSEHTNAYGGSTAHAWGGGTEHTDAYGATAYRPPAYPGYRPPAYPVYHPPVAVPVYSAGCYGCAAAAGAVVGMAAGAAVASANTAAATSNAYAAGVAAGAASVPAAYAMGVSYAVIPAGCATPSVGGSTYYLCGNTWFKPMYGANGVYYRVVPTP
jgi:hypothetical protein